MAEYSFNRTIEELKFCAVLAGACLNLSFNRTIEELKFKINLLICIRCNF